MNRMKKTNATGMYLLVIQILLAALLAIFQMRKTAETPYSFFWLIFIPLILVSFAALVKLPAKYRLLSLLVLDFGMLSINAFYNMSEYNVDLDTGFELGFSNTILEKRYVDPFGGTGLSEAYYGFNPLLHMMIASLSLISGISVFKIGFFIYIFVLRVLFMIIILNILRELISDSHDLLRSLAIFLFIITPRYFVMNVTRRSTAAIFILISIYLLLKIRRLEREGKISSRNKYALLFFGSSFLVVLSDHTHAYLFALILLSAYVFEKAYVFLTRKKDGGSTVSLTQASFYISSLIMWEMFIAYIFIIGDFHYLTSFVGIIVGLLRMDLFLNMTTGTEIAFTIITNTERYLAYLSQALILLVAGIGFLMFIYQIFVKKKHGDKIMRNEPFAMYAAFLGLGGYVFLSIVKLTSFGILANTFFWLPSLFVSVYFAYAVYPLVTKKNLSIVVALLFLVIYVCGLFSLFHPSVFNRTFGEAKIVEYEEERTSELIASGHWLKENSQPDDYIISDTSVQGVYGGFYNLNIMDPFWFSAFFNVNHSRKYYTFYYKGYKGGINIFAKDRETNIDYLVLNRDLMEFSSYNTGRKLTVEEINTLERLNVLCKVYNNDRISIYKRRKFTPYVLD